MCTAMYTLLMVELSLSQARARLPELLDRVAAGEEVHISRHGRALAVLINHDRWMKTRTHDVLIEAHELRKRLEAAREHPIAPESLARDYDVDDHVAWLRDEEGRRAEAEVEVT
jgi:prevent-host-death family protein